MKLRRWQKARSAANPTHRPSARACASNSDIVDDEEALRAISCRMLASLGHSVQAAASPEEALELVHKDPSAFDLVVTDQTMPNMTGLVLIDRLRELSPSVEVVLMSGFNPSLLGRSASESRIDAILGKPFTRGELAAAIRIALLGPGE